MRLLILLILSAAAGALATPRGGKLYIRANDTLLLKDPKAGSATVQKLKQGAEVTWLGPSEKDKQWHLVQVNGKQGFVRQNELSPNQPQSEIDSVSGKPMSAPSFANSGAGAKDYPPPMTYAHTQAYQTAAAELIYVEQLNLSKATPAAIAAKDKELHGP